MPRVPGNGLQSKLFQKGDVIVKVTTAPAPTLKRARGAWSAHLVDALPPADTGNARRPAQVDNSETNATNVSTLLEGSHEPGSKVCVKYRRGEAKLEATLVRAWTSDVHDKTRMFELLCVRPVPSVSCACPAPNP